MTTYYTPDPRIELLECSDLLLAAAEWQQSVKDWQQTLMDLTHQYQDADQHILKEVELENGDKAWEPDHEHPSYLRWVELMEKIDAHGPPPLPPFDQDEFNTALWQLPELAVGLMMVFAELVDEVNGTAQAEREEVQRIIRPQLYVPGR